MEMTIDTAIQNIEIVKEDYWEDDGYGNETKEYEDTMQSFDMLIDIAKKYQKITEIANDKNINGDLLRMSEIRWVIKDGDKH